MLRELSNEAGEVKTNDKNISAVLTSLNDKFFHKHLRNQTYTES